MTVYIHPKDSGPIDTATKRKCQCCDRTVALRGNRVYRDVKPSDRRTRPWHTSYRMVCPYCKGSIERPTTETLLHRDCDTAFKATKMLYHGHKNKDTLCPQCEEVLTEDNTKTLSD